MDFSIKGFNSQQKDIELSCKSFVIYLAIISVIQREKAKYTITTNVILAFSEVMFILFGRTLFMEVIETSVDNGSLLLFELFRLLGMANLKLLGANKI